MLVFEGFQHRGVGGVAAFGLGLTLGGQTEFFKEYLLQLLGGIDIEAMTGVFVYFRLQASQFACQFCGEGG